MSEIKVENLTKIFGRRPNDAKKLLAENKLKDEILEKTGMTVGVKQATFEVKQGEVFVIMGLSGSGKSTLVRMLNRLIEPTMVDIWVNHKDVANTKHEELRTLRRNETS